ncbi:dicarboxylate/amino acid:cation symporter [Phenylobacterium sp.]|uniref:dicarboxylate/amino acid:cation symporter n=1 Tax=Phenylobacterium sp. TaxID=1871053 RepID=UPI0039837E25
MTTEDAPRRFGPLGLWLRLKLWQRIFIGLALGVAVGLAWGPEVVQIRWIGDLFVRLIRMLVAPLIFVTISSGVISLGDPKRLGALGLKTFAFYVFHLSIAAAIGLTIAWFLAPGLGIQLSDVSPADLKQAKTPGELFLGIVPLNPVQALAEGDTLAIIFFAAFFGAGVLMAGERGKPVADVLTSATEVFLKLVGAIMEVAPIGVFALIAVVMGTSGPATFVNVFQLACCVVIGATIQTLVVHGAVIRLIAWLPILPFFRGIVDAIMVAFSTASSSATLPVAMRVAEENLGVDKPTSSTVLPLGATIGMDGTGMYMAILALFCAQAFGITVEPAQLLLLLAATVLIAMGAAPVPSGSLFVLPALTAVIGVSPLQTAIVVGFILPFDRILDMMRTVPNVTSDLTVATTLARWERTLDLETYRRPPKL